MFVVRVCVCVCVCVVRVCACVCCVCVWEGGEEAGLMMIHVIGKVFGQCMRQFFTEIGNFNKTLVEVCQVSGCYHKPWGVGHILTTVESISL